MLTMLASSKERKGAKECADYCPANTFSEIPAQVGDCSSVADRCRTTVLTKQSVSQANLVVFGLVTSHPGRSIVGDKRAYAPLRRHNSNTQHGSTQAAAHVLRRDCAIQYTNRGVRHAAKVTTTIDSNKCAKAQIT